MTTSIIIDVEERSSAGKNEARRLRRSGRIPAVLYGAGKPVVPVTVDTRALEAVLHSEAGENSLLQLRLKGKDAQRHAMLKEYQADPVTGRLLHADFIRIEMDTRLNVAVPVRTLGTAPGVKEEGGLLEVVRRELQVECLPADIPEHIDIDISALHIGDHIRLADLSATAKYRFVEEPDTVVITVLTPRMEEAPAEVVPTEPAEPELITRGKKEEAEEAPEAAKPEKKPERKPTEK